MMGEVIKLALSLAGVGLVVALVWWLGLGKGSIASDAEAAEAAEALAADFTAGPVLRDKKGRTALVADASGKGFVLLKQAGEHPCGRYVKEPKIDVDAGAIVVQSDDHWFGAIRIEPENPDALKSIGALAGQAA